MKKSLVPYAEEALGVFIPKGWEAGSAAMSWQCGILPSLPLQRRE